MMAVRWFDRWRDGPDLPELVAIPPTNLLLPSGRGLAVSRGFAIGLCAVTFGEFDLYSKCCGRTFLSDEQWGRETLPVIHVTLQHALDYCGWLTECTDRRYRLPTGVEWELAARAGSPGRFWWGAEIEEGDANYLSTPGYGSFPVRSLQPNPWGLYNTIGNVAEWTNEQKSIHSDEANLAALRGGHWTSDPSDLDLSGIQWVRASEGSNRIGFRVVAEI